MKPQGVGDFEPLTSKILQLSWKMIRGVMVLHNCERGLMLITGG